MFIFNPNFQLTAIFDVRPELLGTEFSGVPVYEENQLLEIAGTLGLDIGIVAVPAQSAERLLIISKCGIKGILNFTEVRIVAPEGYFIKDVNVGGYLETITFYLTNPESRCNI
jgi:redox-sensing transcriptional repressor